MNVYKHTVLLFTVHWQIGVIQTSATCDKVKRKFLPLCTWTSTLIKCNIPRKSIEINFITKGVLAWSLNLTLKDRR